MSRKARLLGVAFAAAGLCGRPLSAEPVSPPDGDPVPVEQRGLPRGAHVPPIVAIDQEGGPRTFESLRGPAGLVLVFVRSADW